MSTFHDIFSQRGSLRGDGGAEGAGGDEGAEGAGGDEGAEGAEGQNFYSLFPMTHRAKPRCSLFPHK